MSVAKTIYYTAVNDIPDYISEKRPSRIMTAFVIMTAIIEMAEKLYMYNRMHEGQVNEKLLTGMSKHTSYSSKIQQHMDYALFGANQQYTHIRSALSGGEQGGLGATKSDEHAQQMNELKLELPRNEVLTANKNNSVHLVSYDTFPPIHKYTAGDTHQGSESMVRIPAEEAEQTIESNIHTSCLDIDEQESDGSTLEQEVATKEVTHDSSDIALAAPVIISPSVLVMEKAAASQEHSPCDDLSYGVSNKGEPCQTTEHSCATSEDAIQPQSVPLSESETLPDTSSKYGLPADVHIKTSAQDSGSTSPALVVTPLGSYGVTASGEINSTHTHQEIMHPNRTDGSMSSDDHCSDTTPQECTEAHTTNTHTIPNNRLICQQDYASVFNENIVMHLHFHQTGIKVILNKNQYNFNASIDCVSEKLRHILSEMHTDYVQEVVVIIDNNGQSNQLTPILVRSLKVNLIDHFSFRICPPEVNDPLRALISPLTHDASYCVVGDPHIEHYDSDGKPSYSALPCATEEAEWVSFLLKCHPLLHKEATKAAVMERMQNAMIIHVATHSDEGYLALAYIDSSHGEFSKKDVFLTPKDIENLSFEHFPVLVVLSSCDSAITEKGKVGIAHAFWKAGAQAVISTSSSVTDNSCLVFMKFFYQYLIVDRMRGLMAHHKAMQSVRCFPELCDPKHWSNQYYSGNHIQFTNDHCQSHQVCCNLGHSSEFPRVKSVKELEAALLASTTSKCIPVSLYSYIQVA